MRTLEFIANSQKLTKKDSCNFDGIVSGTKGYLKAKFDVSSDWKGCGIVAIFSSLKAGEMGVIVDRECIIPSEVLTGSEWGVRLVGIKEEYCITTNKCIVEQERVKLI